MIVVHSTMHLMNILNVMHLHIDRMPRYKKHCMVTSIHVGRTLVMSVACLDFSIIKHRKCYIGFKIQ